jgi:hypothetical protein
VRLTNHGLIGRCLTHSTKAADGTASIQGPKPESGGVWAFGPDAFGDGSGGFVVEFFGDALVGVAGEGGGGVAELFGDDFDVDAGFEGDGGGAVA